MKLTPQQIVQILETPVGVARHIDARHIKDEVVLAERERIFNRYEKIKWKMGFTDASIQARAWWVEEMQALNWTRVWVPTKPESEFSDDEIRETPAYTTIRKTLPLGVSDDVVMRLARETVQTIWEEAKKA